MKKYLKIILKGFNTGIKEAIVLYFKPITWLIGLFKRKPKPQLRTDQQIANDKYRDKYQFEQYDSWWFVKFKFNDEWWYLRYWGEDYVLEETREKAMALTGPEQCENVISDHIKWMKEGRVFLPFRDNG